MIVWDDKKYSVGHELLDKQHKQLVTLINEFCEHMSLDTHSEILHDTLQSLHHYAQEHLKFEEKLLGEMGFDNLENHIKSHTDYLEMVTELSMEVINEDISSPVGLQTFLLHWWENHILVEDMAYKPLMLSNERA